MPSASEMQRIAEEDGSNEVFRSMRYDEDILLRDEIEAPIEVFLAAAIRQREVKLVAYEAALSAWQAADKRVREIELKFASKGRG